MNPYSYMNQQPNMVEVVGKTPVDARVKGAQFTLCEFAGNRIAPDDRRYCKFFEHASFESFRCMYYRREIMENDLCMCDCRKEG